jgi:hypothetical protein
MTWSNINRFCSDFSQNVIKTLNLLKLDNKKIILDKYPSYSAKTKLIKVIFLMNFVRGPTHELQQKTLIYLQRPMSTA